MDVKTSSRRRTSRSKPRSSSAKDTLAGAVVPGGFLVGFRQACCLVVVPSEWHWELSGLHLLPLARWWPKL